MHDTIDSEFCQFGNPPRESASEQVGLSPGFSILRAILISLPKREMEVIAINRTDSSDHLSTSKADFKLVAGRKIHKPAKRERKASQLVSCEASQILYRKIP